MPATTNEMLFELLERMFELFEETPDGWYHNLDAHEDGLVDDLDTITLLNEVAEYLYRGEADAIEG